MIVNVSNVPKGGVQVLFEHQKQQSLPLDPAHPEHLSVWSPANLPSCLPTKYKPKRKKVTTYINYMPTCLPQGGKKKTCILKHVP